MENICFEREYKTPMVWKASFRLEDVKISAENEAEAYKKAFELLSNIDFFTVVMQGRNELGLKTEYSFDEDCLSIKEVCDD